MVEVLNSGYIKRYSKSVLSGGWNQIFITVCKDSRLTMYKKQGDKSQGSIIMKDVRKYFAIGKYTEGMPDRPELPRGQSVDCLMGVPQNPSSKAKIHWLLFPSQNELDTWMKVIISTLPAQPQSNPNPDVMKQQKAPQVNAAPPPMPHGGYPPQPQPVPPPAGYAPPPLPAQSQGQSLGFENLSLGPNPGPPPSYSQAPAPGYPPAPPPAGYPAPPYNYPQQPAAYPQQPVGYAPPPPAGYPQQQYYAQRPAAPPQGYYQQRPPAAYPQQHTTVVYQQTPQTVIVQDRSYGYDGPGTGAMIAGVAGGALLGYGAASMMGGYGGYGGCGGGWGVGRWGSWSSLSSFGSCGSFGSWD